MEQQIEDMLLSLDYRQLIKELDYEYMCSGLGRVEIVRILSHIKAKENDITNKKLQKLINQYAVEHNDMVVLKS